MLLSSAWAGVCSAAGNRRLSRFATHDLQKSRCWNRTDVTSLERFGRCFWTLEGTNWEVVLDSPTSSLWRYAKRSQGRGVVHALNGRLKLPKFAGVFGLA